MWRFRCSKCRSFFNSLFMTETTRGQHGEPTAGLRQLVTLLHLSSSVWPLRLMETSLNETRYWGRSLEFVAWSVRQARREISIFALSSRVSQIAPQTLIGQFQKYHNTLCLSSQILHRHCFHFLLGLTIVPWENKNNAYVKFWRTNKEYYGTFESGPWTPPKTPVGGAGQMKTD